MTGPTLLTISPGPRQLRLMPDDEQAGLDPYIAQIIGNRKSGLSLNHIVGCTLNCGYCVRHFWGNFDMKIPQLLVPTEQAIELLINHRMFAPHVTPLQIFNKATDPFLPGVKPHLFQVLAALDERGFTNHMLVITRFKVTADDMVFLESLEHLRVTLLFTYSGITDDRIEPIAKSNMTVTSIRTAAEHRDRTGVILYWRPITPGWNDSPETMAHVLDVGRDVDAMVFTGLYHKQENATYLENLGVTVPYSEDEYHRRKTMAAALDSRVVAAWRASGTTTPLFRKTSCGVAFAQTTFDYNGHWGVRELCDICPLDQQRRCADALRQPTDDQMRSALDHFGFDTPWDLDDGHVWTAGLGEQRRYALQHHFQYQMWDIETPHVLGAHGRSMTGHDVDPDQAADFERVRRTFALARSHRGRLSAGTVNAVTTESQPWHTANLVALDLEGSGAQERDQEQILEIATVRLLDGHPDMATAYTTGIDPGRTIPARSWISPGLAGTALRGQPTLDDIRPALAARLNGAWLVGHNIGVDWRLLHRHLPGLTLAGLIDTMRLAKAATIPGRLGLTDLLTHLQLTAAVTAAAPGSQPHRALWDTTGAALLLPALIRRRFPTHPTLQQLIAVAGIPTTPAQPAAAAADTQPTLFD